jgi:hypothetical protein
MLATKLHSANAVGGFIDSVNADCDLRQTERK